ncbi:hypothetical protein Gferi_21685 [Geosporobacter ferrireducens]|uniref:Uncharacterized protein n=1 Tax=Geosporobacter ferrireducens TaxID=1424294 RepID=A0A1D8GLX0_9FIRM|nr:hypothetical protein Gferi_21685 [Geosporobacter ferrireducens]
MQIQRLLICKPVSRSAVMILALAAVARNTKSAAESEGNAVKPNQLQAVLFLYTQGMWSMLC